MVGPVEPPQVPGQVVSVVVVVVVVVSCCLSSMIQLSHPGQQSPLQGEQVEPQQEPVLLVPQVLPETSTQSAILEL